MAHRTASITPKRLVLPDAADEEPLPSSETDNVKVFVRTRPVNEREVEFGASPARCRIERHLQADMDRAGRVAKMTRAVFTVHCNCAAVFT